MPHRNSAATLPFARIFPGAAIVAALSTSEAFAAVLAAATMLINRGTASLGLARILSSTSVGVCLTAPLRLARIHPFACMLRRCACIPAGRLPSAPSRATA